MRPNFRSTGPREHINAIQTPTPWPTEVDEYDHQPENTTYTPAHPTQDDTIPDTDNVPNHNSTPTVRRKSTIPPWFFTILCMIFVVTPSGITGTIDVQPMLCQSHASPMIYRPPLQYNCSFQLSDERPGPDKATLQLYKRNIIKYRSSALLCTRLQTTIRRLTYFAAVSHREEVTIQHLPVTLQTEQNFVWTQDQQDAFDHLKHASAQDVILKFPRFDQPFQLATDASQHAIGAVLSQEHNGIQRPVAFYSRAYGNPRKTTRLPRKKAWLQ